MVHKILQIIPDFGLGGAERMAVHLMTSLGDAFQVRAISMFNPVGSDMEEQLSEAQIPVDYLGKHLGLDIRMFSRIDRVVRTFKPDVVHTHRYVLQYCLPALIFRRVPVVVHTVHSVAEKEVSFLGRCANRLGFAWGVKPVAIAEEVQASLTRVYRLTSVDCIPNGVPLHVYRTPVIDREKWRVQEGFRSTDVLYTCLARLSHPKNHSLLLRAFAQGPAQDQRTHLLLVGAGDQKSMLERMVGELGLTSRVHFMGFRTDVSDILGASDVFVLASKWEGNPLSVMEAMTAGKAVLCTAVGGIPELIQDGVNGMLVASNDPDAFAGAMVRLLLDVESRQRLGAEAAKKSAVFNLQLMTQRYEQLYLKLLMDSNNSGRRD